MVGVICKRDILVHPFVTIHCFGWPVFFRALVAGRNQTFLSLLTEPGLARPSTVQVPAVVERCIKLELRAKRIYEMLAQRFSDPTKGFFQALARQEQAHAQLLELCRTAAEQSRWNARHFDPWRDAVPRLEQQMREAEMSVDSVHSSEEALRLVIEIESSEVNQVFQSIVAVSDSDFVKVVRAFQNATSQHISFICEEIPKLAPDLAQQCQEMQCEFLGS
jgi:rubrerythrin